MIYACPPKYYVNKRDGGAEEVCKIESYTALPGVGANTQLIAGIPNKRIRVMGYKVHSQTATQAAYALTNGSGGTNLDTDLAPIFSDRPMLMPITDPGYFETTTGTGLFITVTIGPMYVTIYYITYTPN